VRRNGRWKREDGTWEMGDGRWEMEDGKGHISNLRFFFEFLIPHYLF
jgi:hypothetical protein